MGGTWKWKTPYPGALPESDPRSGSEGTVESQMTKVGVNRPHCQTKKTSRDAGPSQTTAKFFRQDAHTVREKVGLATIEWRLSRPMLARPGPSWHEFGG